MNKENLYTKDSIRTYTGIYINVFEPTPEMINITDIAHALACVPRFGGHLIEPYSVAQHSVMGATWAFLNSRNDALACLLHDASEAYLMDIPSPIKKRLDNYQSIEDGLMRVIAQKFRFEYPLNNVVKDIDALLLQWEWSELMLCNCSTDSNTLKLLRLKKVKYNEAEFEFLKLFKELTK